MPKGRSGIITEEFKGKENTAYHDVEKLFKIYRSVNWKMQIKINQVKRHFQLEYVKFETDSVRYCIDHYGREANVLALVA